jgi:hypothetical protein
MPFSLSLPLYFTSHVLSDQCQIWLQQNTTDIDVGQELLEFGIPKEDIVLGLHPPYKRPYTGYGVA